MAISDIKPGMRGIRVEGVITRKGDPHEIPTRYGPALVSDAELRDPSGRIAWRLWREQIGMVRIGDRVLIENAFARSFGETAELNIGKDGRITLQAHLSKDGI
jgi:ssDNA-binding replication factor A large subunit